ncbi:hypothetical protein D3C81_1769900 [compost metagenome]
MRFSRNAVLAESRSCAVSIVCTLAWSAAAGAGVAAGAAAPALAAGAAVSSLPEQAANAANRTTGASRRALPWIVTYDIKHPLESTNVDCPALGRHVDAAFPGAASMAVKRESSTAGPDAGEGRVDRVET